MSSAGMAGWTIACPWTNARPSRERLRVLPWGRAGHQSNPHLVLIRGDLGASQFESCRRVLQSQGDLVGEAVPAKSIDREGDGSAAADVEAGRHHAQCEIRPGRADAQAVGEFRAALVLRIAEVDVVGAIRGQSSGEVGIRVVRVQARAFVLVVVIEGELLAGGIAQFEHGIQRRVQPAGIDLRNDRIPGRPSKRNTSQSPG